MAAPKPFQAREPSCAHFGGEGQPASMCDICVDGPAMRTWREEWAAWLAENPDSPEAVHVRELDASRKRGNGRWWDDPVQKGNTVFSVNANLRYNARNS